MNKFKQGASNELQRGIKSWQIALIGTGGVVGSCYFLGLGPLIRDMGPAVLLAFLAVAMIVYGMMLSYAELLVNLPCKGSFISYSKEFLGQTLSVGIGWAFWFNWVCYVPSEAIAVAVVVNAFFPGNQAAYAIGALILLTIINLSAVSVFARIESALAIIKICIISLFCIISFGIWIGLWGSNGFLGGGVNFSGGDLGINFFPNGAGIVLTSMVVVIANFQGIEILGLAASETQNADRAVPAACKTATFLVMGLYLIPIIFILGVFPTGLATLDDVMFAQVFSYYHLDFWAAVMSAVVLFAAFSCANTGLYGAARCLYGLSTEGLAPQAFGRLDRHASPRNAVLFTLGAMWIVLMLGLSAGGTTLYESLLRISGFSGTLAWIGIIASQMRFRRRLLQNGYAPYSCLKAAVPKKQRWITVFSLVAQVICLVMLAFGEGQQSVFLIACMAVMLPMLISLLLGKLGRTYQNCSLDDNMCFAARFPVRK